MDFTVPSGTMEAKRCGGTLGSVFLSIGGVLSAAMSSEGKNAADRCRDSQGQTKENAYRMSDSGSLCLWVTTAGGKLWR